MESYSISAIDPAYLALLASVMYSITLIFFRHGLEHGSPFMAVLLINVLVCIAGFFSSFLVEEIPTISTIATYWFVITGIVGFGIAHLFALVGIQRIGVNRSAPITASTPIWSVLFAIFFLKENPSFYVLLGTVLIAGGVWILSFKKEGKEFQKEDSKSGLIYSLLASILFSIMPIFLKYAYFYQGTPFWGLGVAFGSGAIVVLFTKLLFPKWANFKTNKLGIRFFFIAAFFNILASIFMWHSMHKGDVSIIIPVSRLNTLWVLVLSYFFLKKIEALTLRISCGAIVVLIGGMLVILNRNQCC